MRVAACAPLSRFLVASVVYVMPSSSGTVRAAVSCSLPFCALPWIIAALSGVLNAHASITRAIALCPRMLLMLPEQTPFAPSWARLLAVLVLARL